MGLSSGFLLFAGILLLNSDFTHAQTRRNQSPRAGPTGRALGINPKSSAPSSSSLSSEFQCPEEFGYFPHPTDCSLYYVCVFGGALLESCTGGLMYSHELQTCDWPRNVGCEASDINQGVTATPAREVTPRVPQVPSRVRFSSVNVDSSALSASSGASGPSAPAHIQQIQTLPPPPDQLRISPKPIITSRGQPPNFASQDEILKQLYAEAHDTLPPAEEEEYDRQQRVNRGQPSTVTQVQRDRDGIIHQPSVNAIPTQQKIGSFAFSNSQIPTFTSEDELQDLDIMKTYKVLDRKRRDLSSRIDSNEESKTKTEHLNNDSQVNTDKHVEKRSNDDQSKVIETVEDMPEILEGSENSDDVQRRTRQLRPSIINSPWRISSARAVNFAPSHQNSFGSSFNGFPSATAGFLYKSDGRFYPTNPFKASSDDFQPVISTYSGNNKNKYKFQSFGSGSSGNNGYVLEPLERDQDATPKHKQSSKIPSQSSALLPLIYSLESFQPKSKQSTTQSPLGETQDNYSYFHLGKSTSSQSQHSTQQQNHEKVKTYVFPVNSNKQQTTTQRSFVSFNSVGGFFNNNQQQQHQGFINKATPAPIYEGIKSASSYDSRYTTPSPIKNLQSTHHYSQNAFLNNLNFNGKQHTSSVYNIGIDNAKNQDKQHEQKLIEITTKKLTYKHQYPIPTSTPKYIQSYTTPNQLFDVDKFIAEIRETQRVQNYNKHTGSISGHIQQQQQQPVFKINNNNFNNKTVKAPPNVHYQYFTSPSPILSSSTTALPDEYYYDDEDEEPTYNNGANLSKYKVQSDKVNNNQDNFSSHTLSKKPNLISSNDANFDDDEYYEDEYEDEEDDYKILPPPINKPKYTPMTETMAPRPINVTTIRPYYVSGQTFNTPPPATSTVPSIIKFPDDVFQAIRPFTSLAPKSNSKTIQGSNKIIKPNNHLSGSFDITKGTTTTTKLIPTTSTSKFTTTERVTTTRKIKISTGKKHHQTTSTTIKPTRISGTTTKRKQYTSKSNVRGTLRFKPSTKRPDLTRLEIDEKLPNRVEQSSPAPSSFSIPTKTQITQNKNYYNTSNYNTNFDPYYPSYDDGVDIYSDVDYSNIYNNPPKSTPSSTYRQTTQSTTQSPQTFASKPQTQSTTYLTQTSAPKQKFNQNIYSSADYDEGLVSQLEESERYGQEDQSDFRGDRNELSSSYDRMITKLQSTSSYKYDNGQKYSSIPAIVKLSTPEPFSYKPTVPVTNRISSTFSTTRSHSTTKTPFPTTTTLSTTTTLKTTQESPQYYTTRSSLSDGSNKTAFNRYRITLSARAGSLDPIQKVLNPFIVPTHPSLIPSINHTDTFPLTTETTTFTSTLSTSTIKQTATGQPQITHPSVKVVNFQSTRNSYSNRNSYDNSNSNKYSNKFSASSDINKSNNNNNQELVPDQYYYTEQDGPFDYYDHVDEISIQPSSTKTLEKNENNDFIQSSSPSLKSSSNSLSHSSSPIKNIVNMDSKNSDNKNIVFKVPNVSELRYDQSTLKSFFIMGLNPTTENVMSASLKLKTISVTTTEKPPSSEIISKNTRDFDEQRRKILSFIVSENQPSRFKAPITTKSVKQLIFADNNSNLNFLNRDSNKFEYFNTFVNTHSSSTSTIKPIQSTTATTITEQENVVQNSSPKTTILFSTNHLSSQKDIKPIRLASSLPNFEESKNFVKIKNYTIAVEEEIPSFKTRHSLYLKPIEPTTYSPPKPFKITTDSTPASLKTTVKFIEIPTNDYNEDPESSKVHSRRRPYVNDFLTSSTVPTNTRFPPRTTTNEAPNLNESTSPRSIVQSFTSRGLVFKELLNKTFDFQISTKPIVSPYISLEAQRLTNTIRSTTMRSNFSLSNNGKNNHTIKEGESSPNQNALLSSYRSHFLITAPPNINRKEIDKNVSSSTIVPSTYLLPESSTINLTSSLPTTSRLLLRKFEEISSTEHSRGKYRPFALINSSSTLNDNSLHEEATTYSPKIRFTAQTTESILAVSSELPAAVRRKVFRVKSTFIPPVNNTTEIQNLSTERIDVTTYSPSRKLPVERFVASKPQETSDFKPILTKFNEYSNKLSHSTDILGTTSKGSSYNDLTNENFASTVKITERPFFYTRLSNFNINSSMKNRDNLQNFSEPHETSTQKFRATVEMPEMHVPKEKYNILNESIDYRDDSYDEEENDDHIPYIIDDNYDFISSTKSPSTRYFYNTSFSTTEKTIDTTTTTFSTTTFRTESIVTTQTIPTSTLLTSTENLQSTSSTTNPKSLIPPRATRVNNAIKSSIIAGLPRRNSNSASIKCNDVSSNAKCNEIPSRQPNRNSNRGSSSYNGETQSTVSQNSGRGTSPQRTRPTLKPSQSVVKDAQQFVDIYKYPPSRPDPLYPQPVPDKTAAKCRKDVCLLPDCYCGGKDIPGDQQVEQVPQIVLLTFDDSVNDLNKQLYSDLFERGRVNPNGCPISATFYVSHEWTDYSQVQNLYSDGHEMASHTVSHSFGEQFSLKKWAREIAGQREILSAYGGVKQEDIRGMRAPFLSIGGNKMFKMLYDFNFTYDSSMPVYENRPPSWPYTLDYKIFHDCMIPPCPSKSYPGVWEVPMVMWQDLNGGRCSMGDACSNPADADGVFKMIMKNFERHYTTNRAPFGLFYHAAWFTQPHHKEGFIEFLDTINRMKDVYIVTNWQALQWVRDPTPLSRINSFQPFQCNYQDRPKRCNNPKVCNLWHKSGVRYMRTCQPCPDIYPWTGKTGIRSSRIDNDLEVVEST